MEMISGGNSKCFKENPDIAKKIMNTEDRCIHVVPMDALICLLSPYLRHTTQTMVLKEDTNPPLCYHATTTRKPTAIIRNQVAPVRCNAPIIFGKAKQKLYTNIYNTRISYPLAMILLAMGDTKACIRFAWIHADLTGAFVFFANDLYNLATAMVFGLTASASSLTCHWIIIRCICKPPWLCPEAQ